MYAVYQKMFIKQHDRGICKRTEDKILALGINPHTLYVFGRLRPILRFLKDSSDLSPKSEVLDP